MTRIRVCRGMNFLYSGKEKRNLAMPYSYIYGNLFWVLRNFKKVVEKVGFFFPLFQ